MQTSKKHQSVVRPLASNLVSKRASDLFLDTQTHSNIGLHLVFSTYAYSHVSTAKCSKTSQSWTVAYVNGNTGKPFKRTQ